MNYMKTNAINRNRGYTKMEILIPLAILGLWVALQVWVLPRCGVKT